MRKSLLVSCAGLTLCTLLTVGATGAAGYTLNVTLNGTGGGSLNSNPSGTITCTYPPQAGTCSATLPAGTSLSLLATPSGSSFFGGWDGSCSSCYDLACLIVLNNNKSCTASFTTLPPLRIAGSQPVYYSALQSAFNAAATLSTIQAREVSFSETLKLSRPVTLLLRGGYDATFSARTGHSQLKGKLAIASGKVIVDRLLITAAPAGDTQPPSVPANLRATAVGAERIDLAWNAATDNVAVTGYEIYRGGSKVGTGSGTSFSDTGRTASTNYCYTVLARDAAGNKSGQSAQACATTGAATSALVTLDSEGRSVSTVTVAGPGGAQLTLYAGTRVALIGAGGVLQTPAAEDQFRLSLGAATGTLPSLQDGISTLAQLRVVLTVNDSEREARFWPGSTGAADQRGLKLVVPLGDQSADERTLGLLFQVWSGKAVPVGTSIFTLASGSGRAVALAGQAARTVASATQGSGQMQFSPTGTGSYIVGGSDPATGSGSAPGGAFWSSFTLADPGCVPVGNVQVCGPSMVDRIEIIEESTADILGMCWFGDSNQASTGVIPPGYQFWCERSQGAGGATEIKISSMQANLPWIRAYWVRSSDRLPMWMNYSQPTGGLHGADGAVYSDPYQQKDFEFAGYKKLTFTTTTDKKYDFYVTHALRPPQDEGYTANSDGFDATNPGFVGLVGVYDTLDARVLLEENVIKKEGLWKVRAEETRGNKGTYEYQGKYKGTTKASMYFLPPFDGTKIWEITGNDITFEMDPSMTFPDTDVLTTTGGTITQTVYTVPDPTGLCYGLPSSFTNTYPVFPGDGYLFIKTGENPIQYRAGASVSERTPLVAHSYTRCCSYTQPPCEEMTMEANEQEHQWLYMEETPRTVLPDGTLQGSYDTTNFGKYEWNLRLDEN